MLQHTVKTCMGQGNVTLNVSLIFEWFLNTRILPRELVPHDVTY